MGNTTARITVRDKDQDHTLFSISERPKGDIIVVQKIAPVKPREDMENVSGARFTIHPSPNSTNNVNAIQWTSKLASGGQRRSENYTKAIKTAHGFASVGCFRVRRPMDFTITKSDKALNHSVGEMDSEASTLFLTLALSDESVAFPNTQFNDLSATSFRVSRFNFVLLSSFAPIPSHDSHDSFLNATLPLEVGIVTSEEGVLADELVDIHRQMRAMLFDKFGRNLVSNGSPCGNSPEFQVSRRFFKSGIPDASWSWWLQSMRILSTSPVIHL